MLFAKFQGGGANEQRRQHQANSFEAFPPRSIRRKSIGQIADEATVLNIRGGKTFQAIHPRSLQAQMIIFTPNTPQSPLT